MPNCKCISPSYQDRVNLMSDAATDDDPKPSYTTTTVPLMPCNIVTVKGDETYRGRQLEARLSHVVETPWRSGVNATQRLVVAGGIYDADILNIEYSKPMRMPGHPPILALYCTELEP